MVHSCIVKGCTNKSNNPDCYHLSWHRLPVASDKLQKIKRSLDIPEQPSSQSRICSDCMSKIHVHKPRKLPYQREDILKCRQRPTREESRQIIAHDHSDYSLPPDKAPSCAYLSSIGNDHNIPLSSPAVAPITLREQFSIEMFVNDNHAITFYTSFPSYAHFMICFNYLGTAVNHLVYPGSSKDIDVICRLKSQRTLSPKNEFFLTLCRLRCGLMEQDLAYRFNISQATVSRIFIAWVNFLYYRFIELPIWPTKGQVQELMPFQFKQQYPNTRIIIDATELFIQRPSDPLAQLQTFSSYKNHNTAKALAGITPSGYITTIWWIHLR